MGARSFTLPAMTRTVLGEFYWYDDNSKNPVF